MGQTAKVPMELVLGVDENPNPHGWYFTAPEFQDHPVEGNWTDDGMVLDNRVPDIQTMIHREIGRSRQHRRLRFDQRKDVEEIEHYRPGIRGLVLRLSDQHPKQFAQHLHRNVGTSRRQPRYHRSRSRFTGKPFTPSIYARMLVSSATFTTASVSRKVHPSSSARYSGRATYAHAAAICPRPANRRLCLVGLDWKCGNPSCPCSWEDDHEGKKEVSGHNSSSWRST
jgi:hypothetical protein